MSFLYRCDFCDKNELQVRKIIARNTEKRYSAAICDECVRVCDEVIAEDPAIIQRAMMELL